MKNAFLLLLLGFGLLMTGCSTYYFSTVESYHNRLPSTENGYFSTTKNNIVVTYSFREYGGKVNYEVYNMSDDPIFIDLDKSTLIAEDYAIHQLQSVSDPVESEKVFEAIAQNLSSDTTVTSAVNLFKQLSQSQSKLFVPPNSRTNFSPVSLYDLYDMRLPKQVYDQVRVGEGHVRGVYFTPVNSPLIFRTYLTVVNGKDQSETVFEDIFYVSRAYKASSSDILMGYVKQRGDMYYFFESNETAKLLGWTVVGIAAIAGAAALAGDQVVEEISY